MTLVYSRGISSRSKLEIRDRKYVGLYRKRRTRTDQVLPALIEGARQHRRGRNVMETMSKRNYVIGVREPIGGDRSPRRHENRSGEYPLPVVKRNGVGKSKGKERSVARRKEAIVKAIVTLPPVYIRNSREG